MSVQSVEIRGWLSFMESEDAKTHEDSDFKRSWFVLKGNALNFFADEEV